MKKLQLLITSVILLFGTNLAFAQTLESNTKWLSFQLDRLVKEKDGNHLKVNDNEAVPTFKFKGCQMNMNIDARDSDLNFGMRISWLLKDVQKISYDKEDSGEYQLKMIVPADRMRMKVGFGQNHNIGGSFNLKNDDDNESKTNFSLHTKDERLVKEIVNKFEESVKICKNTR
ncbi:hypothetical protein [Emticicia sp. TH156]|uniref:hypothetical protein n=1 Tax=Emticicia sp. TH156 TaxID=2067454 RepID=UPI000C78DDF1|nr:hypothetical protein [Emticicia sp. TH156]PLK45414.1 hypothetical protein C0V77_04525 [Emticicia sp. TH156]